jgi:hypothetical protein
MKKLILSVLAICTLGSVAFGSTQFLGGNSLNYTMTAHSLEPGRMTMNWYSRAWAKSIDGANVSDVSQALVVSFGFSRHVEIEIASMLYQDLNLSGRNDVTYNMPDDIYLRFKFGGYALNVMGKSLTWGFATSFRAAAAKYSNVYLEPYNAGANEFSLGFLSSWYQNQLYPLEGRSLHFNLHYLNHNDGGSSEALDVFTGVSHDLEYGLAYRHPLRRWEFFGELHGNTFLKRPENNYYQRANVMWLQPGATFHIFAGMAFTMGLDFRLFESGPALYYDDVAGNPVGLKAGQRRPSESFPDYYPSWRFNAKFTYQPSTAFRAMDTFGEVRPESERDWDMREKLGVTEREMIDWLGVENEGAEFLDLELEKIRAERRRAEKDLERLKEKMKEEGE